MKSKFKFEPIDILLSVFLIIAIGINVWAFWPKRAPSPGSASGPMETFPKDGPKKSDSESREPNDILKEPGDKPTEPNLGSQEEKLDILSPADLEGIWNVDLIYYSDTKQELPYAFYELIFTFKHTMGNDYNVDITTTDNRFADPDLNPDVPPKGFAPSFITDSTSARLEQGNILYFNFSFEPENIFKIPLQRENDNIVGKTYHTPETGLPKDEMYAYLELKKNL